MFQMLGVELSAHFSRCPARWRGLLYFETSIGLLFVYVEITVVIGEGSLEKREYWLWKRQIEGDSHVTGVPV